MPPTPLFESVFCYTVLWRRWSATVGRGAEILSKIEWINFHISNIRYHNVVHEYILFSVSVVLEICYVWQYEVNVECVQLFNALFSRNRFVSCLPPNGQSPKYKFFLMSVPNVLHLYCSSMPYRVDIKFAPLAQFNLIFLQCTKISNKELRFRPVKYFWFYEKTGTRLNCTRSL